MRGVTKETARVTCPYCQYRMPIEVRDGAACHGLWVKCKGRNCGRLFEIKIPSEKIKTPGK